MRIMRCVLCNCGQVKDLGHFLVECGGISNGKTGNDKWS